MKYILLFIHLLSFVFIVPNTGYSFGSFFKKDSKVLSRTFTISPSTSQPLFVGQQIRFIAQGGYPPYRYSTDFGSINGKNGDYIPSESVGQVNITATDARGNRATYRLSIYQNITITPATVSMAILENFKFTSRGGVPPITFSINNGVIDSSSGLATAPSTTGSAVITAMDSLGNKATSNVTIYQSLGIDPQTKAIIAGQTYTFSATGGVGPFTYSANSGAIGLSNGVYTAPSMTGSDIVTVKDSRGTIATSIVTIYPILEIDPKNSILPINGNSTFIAKGGVPPYNYITNNGIIGLTNGVYAGPPISGSAVITVTDNIGNKANTNVTINPELAINPLRINVPINGTANFIASGGISPYTYSATFGGISSSGVFSAPKDGGLSTITVADSTGTKKNADICVFAPLKIFPEEKSLTVGDSFTYSASGGCTPYLFSKDIGTINSLTGLFSAPDNPGTGKVTVTDAANNKITSNITIISSPPIARTHVTIPKGGGYNFTPTSGMIGPFTFSVANGFGTINSSGNYKAPSTEGVSSITVTDSTGVMRVIDICIFAPLEISPSEKMLVIDNTFSFSATHGCKPYVFSTDIGKINSDSGSFTAPSSAGEGEITVTDAGNYQASAKIKIFPPLSLNPLAGNLEFYKKLEFSASGGIPPLSYKSDVGSIDPNGVFIAPGTKGMAVITVSDGGNNSKTANVNIYGPLKFGKYETELVVGDHFDFSAEEGIPPYEYSTDVGAIDPKNGSFNASAAGDVQVTVTDSEKNKSTVKITIHPALAVIPLEGNLQVDKKLNITVSGGIPPYSFKSSIGSIASNKSINNTTGYFTAPSIKGPVTITVSDSVGHKKTTELNVYAPIKIEPLEITLIPGDTFTFKASDGVPPYKFTTVIGKVDSASGLYESPPNAGSGTVTVEDKEGNSIIANVTINPALSLSSPLANLEVNKTLNFSASGGIGELLFSASAGFIDPSSGAYKAPDKKGPVSVSITDKAGHSKSINLNIYDPLNISPPQKVLVLDDNFQFNITGGVLPYKVSAITGQVDLIGYYTARQVGADTITVVDSIGNTVTTSLTINAKLAVSPTLANLEVNKSMLFEVTGGIGPYSYNSSMDPRDFDLNGNFRPIKSGTANITVTDSTGKSVTAVVKVYDPLDISPKQKDLAVVNKFLFLITGGAITGGALPYKEIKADRGVIDSFGNYTAPADVGDGTDKVTVTDIENNIVTARLNIKPALRIEPSSFTMAVNKTIIFTAHDGVGPYTFSVKDNIGVIGLTNGSYQAPPDSRKKAEVTVRDSLGNVASAEVTINPVLSISPTLANLEVNKVLPFTVTGGVGPYTYNSSLDSRDFDINGNFRPIKTGKATIIVTDSAGDSVVALVTVYDPLKISPTSKLLAFGNKFDFTGSGGVPPYTFGFETKIGDITTVGNLGKYSAPSDNPGTGVITLKDSIGNLVKANISINTSLAVNAPNALPVGGNLDFANLISGGIPNYSYGTPSIGTISTDGKYTAPADGGSAEITITDSDGVKVVAKFCVFKPLSISPNSKILAVKDTETFEANEGCKPYKFEVANGIFDFVEGANSGLFRAPESAGIGTVKVIDNVGHNVTANITINPGLAITPTSANLEVIKKLNFTVSGGIAPYTYESSIGSIATNKSVNNTTGFYSAPTTKGTGTITVTDSVGHKITAEVNVYDSLKITPIQKDLAVGNQTNFSIIGGFPALIVKAKRGNIDQNGNYTAPAEVEDGQDTITVTDSENNIATASLNIKPALKIKPNPATLAVNKTLKFEYEGGVGPHYSFEAKNGDISMMTGDYTAPANSGIARVFVTDSFGNRAIADVTINPELKIDPENINLAIDASTKFNATGGVGPYTFSVPQGMGVIFPDNSYIAPHTKGLVQITVTDSEGSSKIANVNIYLPLKISPEEKILAVGNHFDFDAIEGVPPYVFSSDNNIGSIITNGVKGPFIAAGSTLPAEGYVTLKDSANPDNQVTAKVTVNPPLSIEPKPAFLAINGTYDFKASTKGGAPDYTYSADNGSFKNGIYIAPDTSGTALITVKDSMGGEATASLCIYAPLEFDPGDEVVLAQGNTFTFKAKEGCKPYTFMAKMGSINADSGLFTAPPSTGPGKIIVTDAAGNYAYLNITINPPISLSPNIANLEVGRNKDFTASQGVPPYEFTLKDSLGTLNLDKGVVVNYTAPEAKGSGVNTIIVTDNFGNKAEATVKIYDSLNISPSEKKDLEVEKQLPFVASGGVSPYNFSLASSVGAISSSDKEGKNAIFTASGGKGLVTVKLTDSEQNSKTVEINVFDSLKISPSSPQILEAEKEIAFSGSGGIEPYTFSIDPVFGNINGGNYTAPAAKGSTTITVTDSANPANKKTVEVTVYFPLQITPEKKTLAVNSEPFQFKATGGFEPYNFSTNVGSIDNDGTFKAGKDTTYNIEGKVTVTDAAGKTAEASVTLTPALGVMPSLATVSVDKNVEFYISGGVPPFLIKPERGNFTQGKRGFTYTAPSSVGSDTITVTDSLDNSVISTVTINRSLEIIPKTITLAPGATTTFKGMYGVPFSDPSPPYNFSATFGSIDGKGVYTFPTVSNQTSDEVRVYDKNSFESAIINRSNWVGTKQFGFATATSSKYKTRGQGIISDPNGNVYVTGHTNGNLDGTLTGTQDSFVRKYNSAGEKQWTKLQGAKFGNAKKLTSGNAITIDTSGNLYVTGHTTGNLFGTLTGATDFFLTKYDSAGTIQWTKQNGILGSETFGNAITLDSSGNIYVTGYIFGDLDEDSATPKTEGFFISKYKVSGEMEWTNQLRPDVGKNARGQGITTDSSGNVFVTGYTNGAFPESTKIGTFDAFLIKYNSSGVLSWIHQQGKANAKTFGMGITSDSSGNVYVAGITNGALDGNSRMGIDDVLVTKFDSDGNKKWTRQMGVGGKSANGIAIRLDSSANVYLTGLTTGGLDGNSMSTGATTDFFAIKYDTEGNKQWTRQLGGGTNSLGAGTDSNGLGVTVDSSGNAFVTGYTTGNLDGNTLTGSEDGFVTKYNTAGDKQ